MAKGTKTGGGSRKGVPNKATADIKVLAQQYGESAIVTLHQIMMDNGQPPAARVAASKELLDRGYGKSVQKSDLTSSDGTMTPKGLSDFYAGIASATAADA